MKHYLVPVLLSLSFVLAACSATTPPTSAAPPPVPAAAIVPTQMADPAAPSNLFPNTGYGNELTRLDSQGAVIVEITPLNLDAPGNTLEFEVALNTHSLDLSMDLATLATLKTDTGITAEAIAWDAPRGGHHVSGRLIFPAVKDGRPVLDGAGQLTLTLLDVDAPSRVFEWDLK